MGISGLLKYTKDAWRQGRLKIYSVVGKRSEVDKYRMWRRSWRHYRFKSSSGRQCRRNPRFSQYSPSEAFAIFCNPPNSTREYKLTTGLCFRNNCYESLDRLNITRMWSWSKNCFRLKHWMLKFVAIMNGQSHISPWENVGINFECLIVLKQTNNCV